MGKITINGIALSEYRFVTGDGACEKFAASELKSYFKKITGKEFSDNGKKIIRLNVDKSRIFIAFERYRAKRVVIIARRRIGFVLER